jgi:large subunit ribosomal protein L11
MAKEVVARFKLQCPGGQATPAPPVGPALGQHGVNIPEFIRQFNDRTREAAGKPIPVVVTVYRDRSFTFEIKSPPASFLLREAAGVAKGSGEPHKEKVGRVTRADLVRIAQEKMADLNAASVEQAAKMIAGTARSMGIEVDEERVTSDASGVTSGD